MPEQCWLESLEAALIVFNGATLAKQQNDRHNGISKSQDAYFTESKRAVADPETPCVQVALAKEHQYLTALCGKAGDKTSENDKNIHSVAAAITPQ